MKKEKKPKKKWIKIIIILFMLFVIVPAVLFTAFIVLHTSTDSKPSGNETHYTEFMNMIEYIEQ